MKVRLLPPFISGEYKIDDTLRNSSEELLRYRQHLTIKLNVLLWYLGTLQPNVFFQYFKGKVILIVRDLKSLVHQGFKSFITSTCFLISFYHFWRGKRNFRIREFRVSHDSYNEN